MVLCVAVAGEPSRRAYRDSVGVEACEDTGVKILIVTCKTCGQEINRTKPLPDGISETRALVGATTQCFCNNSGHNSGPDCNLNWEHHWEQVADVGGEA